MNNGERGHEFLNFKTNIRPFSSILASKLIFKVLASSGAKLFYFGGPARLFS